MKFSVPAVLAALSCTSSTLTTVSAFTASPSATASTRVSSLNSAATATVVATSFEEDLALTLNVILDHEARSTTTSKDQMLSQMKEAEEMPAAQESVDLSIPYNAAAMLAYEATGSSGDFATFEKEYVADTVAMVTAKKAAREAVVSTETKKAAPKQEKAPTASAVSETVDLSIPYDAAAQLAYTASNQKMNYDSFKEQFMADARSAVMAKGDLSVNYDSAALLAYMASNRKMPYDAFVEQYKADARSAVMAKGDLSVNYDSAALLAYSARGDRSVPFEEFKATYEAAAVADVIAKKEAREAATA